VRKLLALALLAFALLPRQPKAQVASFVVPEIYAAICVLASCSADEVWGFADLHAHPASHLAFGADDNGTPGIFHGKPGLRLEDAPMSLLTDLEACSPETHSGPLVDYVTWESRKGVLAAIDKLTGWPHTKGGAPDFGNWPAALSISHQQMHITDIRRAYDGGLRLMVANATDNELLWRFWNNNSVVQTSVPQPQAGFDMASAIKQINFIRDLAGSNSSWMAVVTTAAEARQAIRGGKLAIVLGLEMDWLSINEMDTLVTGYGVRHLIPIHLADNLLGGTAIYSEAFNTLNYYFNRKFFRVQADRLLSFRLSWPPTGLRLPSGSGLEPKPFTSEAEAANYVDNPSSGHKNVVGLKYTGWLVDLMKKGVLVDVAHMSERSIDDSLAVAERYGYPLMNSHTGIRTAPIGTSERDMSDQQVRRLRELGGLIGLGVVGAGGDDDGSRLAKWLVEYHTALEMMGNRGVALGTDANGLSPLMPGRSSGPIAYPFTAAGQYRPIASNAVTLDKRVLGWSRPPYSFDVDGMATYGMLPDFLEAINQLPSPTRPTAALAALYRTAEDFIRMWEKAERVATQMKDKILTVAISPQPQAGNRTYTVRVTDASSGSPVAAATVTLRNYLANGTETTALKTTDSAGRVQFALPLGVKVTHVVGGNPLITRPTLTVEAGGYGRYTQTLLAN
jgi:microsomal dipeptidase-like Zn-dependent dipeptidase